MAEVGYQELAGRLRAAITAGEYAPGATLPKQAELAQRWGVSVLTVRRAVNTLAAEGLVTTVRRRGTVVRQRPAMRRMGIDRYAKRHWRAGLVAFAVDREASGQTWDRGDQTNQVRQIGADSETATALGIDPGDTVVERARLVRRDGTPTHTLTSYYRHDDVADTPILDPAPGNASPGGGFAVLTAQGLEPERMTETLQSRMPTPDEARQLEMPLGEPVVILQRTTTTAGGRPVEYARGVHRGSMFVWTYAFTIPE